MKELGKLDIKELRTFGYDGRPLRVGLDNSYEEWYVASDVCAIIGMVLNDALALLEKSDDDDDKIGTCNIASSDGEQPMLMINGLAMFSLIDENQATEVKAFFGWLIYDYRFELGSYKREIANAVGDNKVLYNLDTFVIKCRMRDSVGIGKERILIAGETIEVGPGYDESLIGGEELSAS